MADIAGKMVGNVKMERLSRLQFEWMSHVSGVGNGLCCDWLAVVEFERSDLSANGNHRQIIASLKAEIDRRPLIASEPAENVEIQTFNEGEPVCYFH